MKHLVPMSLVFAALMLAAQQQQPPLAATQDVSGMYTFLKDGEFVQIDVDGERVSGFVSRYGDKESDNGAFLDHMIKEGQLKGDSLHFVTKTVHGVSFEFTGTVGRGDEPNTAKEGYRVLKGKLTQYADEENGKASGKSREVTLKSFPMGELVGKSK
jgi:hypothetical protein